MVSNAFCPQPPSPPPAFSEAERPGAPHAQSCLPEERAPEYSLYPANISSFELQMLGSTINTKEKFLCGDLLDGRYFLLGTTNGLDFIDLSLPAEVQVPKRIIDFVRFKQIRVVQTGKYDALLALCGKNSHLRCYSVNSIRSSIHSMTRRDPPEPSLRSRRVSMHSRARARSMDLIFEPDTSSPDRLTHAAGGDPPSTMETMDEETDLPASTAPSELLHHRSATIPPPEPERNPRMMSRYKRHSYQLARNLFAHDGHGMNASENGPVKPEYSKLPNTRLTILFAVGQGPIRTYVCSLSKQNIFLFELDYGDSTGLAKPEFVHTRTYWLPQTPQHLELAMHGDQLTDIVAMFQTEVILIGVEDAQVRDVVINDKLKPGDEEKDCNRWNTFPQLPFSPSINPDNVADSFTIPPPYSLAISEDPRTLLSPIAITDIGLENSDASGASSLFFASFGRRSMIVDRKGRPYSTVVFTWTASPLHVEFVNVESPSGSQSFAIGFGHDMVEVRSLATGCLVESVVHGAEVQYLGRGRKSAQEAIWGCTFNKGKGTRLYRLLGPRPR